MSNQVELLDIINEKRKAHHELRMNIAICKAGMPDGSQQANTQNEQLKELQKLDFLIERSKMELQ
jgi:hypothetical protein